MAKAKKQIKVGGSNIKTAKDNFIFNTKRPIPAGKEVGFIDGDSKNILFKNLKLVDAQPVKVKVTKPAEKKEKVKEPAKEIKKADVPAF